MEPLHVDKKRTLEQRFGYGVCPFTVEKFERLSRRSLFLINGLSSLPQERYRCAVDGGNARGGEINDIIYDMEGALTPCPQAYAEGCMLYLRETLGDILPVMYPNIPKTRRK